MDVRADLDLLFELETLLRETERALATAGSRSDVLHAVVERSPHAVLVFDERGGALAVNRATRRMWAGRATGSAGVEKQHYPVRSTRLQELEISEWARAHVERASEASGASPVESLVVVRQDASQSFVGAAAGTVGSGAARLVVCVLAETRGVVMDGDPAQGRHRRASILLQASTMMMSSALDPDEILNKLASLTVPAIGEAFLLDLADGPPGPDGAPTMRRVLSRWRDANGARVLAALERDYGAVADEMMGLGRVRRSGVSELHAVDDAVLSFVAHDARHLELLRELSIKSVVIVPVRGRAPTASRGSVLGALALVSTDPRRPFESEDADMVEQLANIAGLAYDNARLFAAEQRARSEMAMLYGLVDAVNRATTVQEILDPALEVVETALATDRSAIRLFDERGVLRFRAWRGLSEPYMGKFLAHAPWSTTDGRPAPLLVADVETDQAFAEDREAFRAEGIAAFGLFPLVHQGRLLGGVSVYSSVPRTFTFEEVRLAQTIAAQISQAVARKRTEREAQRARETAEHASRMKDEFLALVSHELRTPLSAIMGWAAILQTHRKGDPASIAKGLAVIERNAKAQAAIIEDILDVSRIERGKLQLSAQPLALLPVTLEAIDSLRTSAIARSIHVRLDVEDEALALVGDPERVRQILWNLLSNAIKFTPPEGVVHVSLAREPGVVVVRVTDTGKGISSEFLPHVFDAFRQADGSASRREGGLGLGLTIVRHLVELHGGHVTATSDGPGRGATFTVRFPARAASVAPAPASRARLVEAPPASVEGVPEGSLSAARDGDPDLTGVRALIVDDEADTREMVRVALAVYGAEVRVAESAGEAMDVVRTFEPDVLLTDIGMPNEDGYDLLRRVRALPGPRGTVPAIAFTAFAREEDAQRAKRAGFFGHLPKPVRPEVLARTVEDAARARPRDGGGGVVAAGGGTRP